MSTTQTVLIVGGGPCGLVAAHALIAQGFEVRVFERAPGLTTHGAGIVLAVNALRMMATIGLTAGLAELGCQLRAGRVESASGRVLQHMPMGEFEAEYGHTNVAISRARLARYLSERLPEGVVRYACEIVDLGQNDDGVWLELKGGERFEGMALVGCDGIHSQVREHVFGHRELRYSGYTCWRGIAPIAQPDGQGVFIERWHRGLRVGTVPISDRECYWFATANGPAGQRDTGDAINGVIERFAAFTGSVPRVFAAQSKGQGPVLRHDIYDFKPLDRWIDGRIALAGDAAHAMTPNLGQGACQAIEDAVVLASQLRANRADPAAALRAYEAERLPRARGFVQRSWDFGRIATMEGTLGCGLRNFLLPLLGRPALVRRSLRGLYGVAVPDAP